MTFRVIESESVSHTSSGGNGEGERLGELGQTAGSGESRGWEGIPPQLRDDLAGDAPRGTKRGQLEGAAYGRLVFSFALLALCSWLSIVLSHQSEGVAYYLADQRNTVRASDHAAAAAVAVVLRGGAGGGHAGRRLLR